MSILRNADDRKGCSMPNWLVAYEQSPWPHQRLLNRCEPVSVVSNGCQAPCQQLFD